MNKSKVDHGIRVREAKRKFKAFCEEYEVFETLEGYFKEGQKAEVFMGDANKKPLVNPMDTLRFKFTKGNYTYLLMRVPTLILEREDARKRAAINQALGITPTPKPMTRHEFLRQVEIARHQPRPQRGKIGGKSRYLPKSMKPPTEEREKETLEMCREMFKDTPEELTIKTKYDKDED